jgi:hypothetical protein
MESFNSNVDPECSVGRSTLVNNRVFADEIDRLILTLPSTGNTL